MIIKDVRADATNDREALFVKLFMYYWRTFVSLILEVSISGDLRIILTILLLHAFMKKKNQVQEFGLVSTRVLVFRETTES